MTGHTILSCSRCKGNWTTPKVFREIAIALVPDSRPPKRDERTDDAPTLYCPVCRTGMRKVLVHTVAVDECREHGAWFDFAELQGVLVTLG